MSHIDQNNREGCFLISRSIFNSWIWTKPDWYLKLWIYFIGKANHTDNVHFKRGELFLPGGYRDIQTMLMKRGGFGKKRYQNFEISRCISAMTSDGLITTRKTTRGMYIIVNNYNDYQSLQNYEKQQEKKRRNNSSATLVQQSASTINKNEKNDNNVKYDKVVAKATVAYGNPDINSIIDYLKDKTGLSELDGSVKQNRNQANNLFSKLKRMYTEHEPLKLARQLVDIGLTDQFIASHMTSISYLFYNTAKIIQLGKSKVQHNSVYVV